MEDYKNQFDKLVYHILLYDTSISETMLVPQFLLGLKDELRHSIEIHLSASVSQAATLVAVQEHLNEKQKPQHRRFPILKTASKFATSNTDLWKARQLKEYIRINNLCFRCGEKYTPTHTCATPVATLNMMVNTSADGGEFLLEEVHIGSRITYVYDVGCLFSFHTCSFWETSTHGYSIESHGLESSLDHTSRFRKFSYIFEFCYCC
jgi:hypothetical protein